MKNIPPNVFEISYSENVFLNESFIQASGNLFSVLYKQYAFDQRFFLMLQTITEIMGNQP